MPGSWQHPRPNIDLDEIAAEAAAYRARVCEALKRHSDPILREIGEQLSSGAITARDVVNEPAYQRMIDWGMARTMTDAPAPQADGRPTDREGSPDRDDGPSR